MPRFKTTHNVCVDYKEFFDPKWAESTVLVLPASKEWDKSYAIDIEDVNLWEVLFEKGGPFGVYAAWDPYEAFFIVTDQGKVIEKFHGSTAKIDLDTYLNDNELPRVDRFTPLNKHSSVRTKI
jgi:hypothetical protein